MRGRTSGSSAITYIDGSIGSHMLRQEIDHNCTSVCNIPMNISRKFLSMRVRALPALPGSEVRPRSAVGRFCQTALRRGTASHSRPIHRLWTDASDEGYGAHLNTKHNPAPHDRLQIRRPPLRSPRTSKIGFHIELHETAALLMALNKWAPRLGGSLVMWYTDSTSAAGKFRQIEPLPADQWRLSRVHRAIRKRMEQGGIALMAQWEPREGNGLADCLSHPDKDCK